MSWESGGPQLQVCPRTLDAQREDEFGKGSATKEDHLSLGNLISLMVVERLMPSTLCW